jgi:hypothetical protein
MIHFYIGLTLGILFAMFFPKPFSQLKSFLINLYEKK